MSIDSSSARRRWSMLGIGLFATLCSNVFINGVAFLIPTLHAEFGLTLAAAGLISAMPKFGMVLTLIPWGYLVDRFGERFALYAGSALTAAAALGAALTQSLILMSVFLFLGGMAAASSNSASGRLVVGWFPAEQRGLAMGIRQTAQPLGVGLGALVMPGLAYSFGLGSAMMFPVAVCAVAAVACAVGVIDPPRPPRRDAPAAILANPYRGSSTRGSSTRGSSTRGSSTRGSSTRGSSTLWRIHAASVLLVVPQALLWTFTLVWLIAERGWSPTSAGALVTVAQILGALGRIVAGRWSDRVGLRLRPIRLIAAAAAASMAALAVTDAFGSGWSVAVMVVASVVTVSDNGLAYTAIAEIAGPFWSGRALGTQNTSQLLATGLTPPLFGALISAAGFPAAFAVCALFPVLAIPLVPSDDDRTTTAP